MTSLMGRDGNFETLQELCDEKLSEMISGTLPGPGSDRLGVNLGLSFVAMSICDTVRLVLLG